MTHYRNAVEIPSIAFGFMETSSLPAHRVHGRQWHPIPSALAVLTADFRREEHSIGEENGLRARDAELDFLEKISRAIEQLRFA